MLSRPLPARAPSPKPLRPPRAEVSPLKRRPSPSPASRSAAPAEERPGTARRSRIPAAADETSGLPPALCASFLVRRLAEEVQSSAEPSRWSEPDDEDLLGPEVCMALCTMRLNVESVLRQFNSNQFMGASGSANSDYIGPLRRCGEALLSTIPIVCDEAHCLAEACLSQAVEGLIDAIIGRAQKKHVTSASKLPSWCCDSKDPPAAKEIDTTSVTDAVKAYCEA